MLKKSVKTFVALLAILLLGGLLIWLNPTLARLDRNVIRGNRFRGLRDLEQSRPITYRGGQYFRKFAQVSRQNFLFFSLFHADYGWFGTLRRDGSTIDPSRITDSSNYYYDKNQETILGILGICIPVYNHATLNFEP